MFFYSVLEYLKVTTSLTIPVRWESFQAKQHLPPDFRGEPMEHIRRLILRYHEGNITWHLIIWLNLWRNPFHLGVLGCNAWLIFSLHHNPVDSAWEQETHFEISSHLVHGPKFPIWESSHKSVSCVVSSSKCQVFQDHFLGEQELTSFVYLASQQIDLHLGQYIFAWQLHPLRCSGWVRWGVRLCWTLMPYMSNLPSSPLVGVIYYRVHLYGLFLFVFLG